MPFVFHEPGFILLISLLVFAAAKLASSLYLRPIRKRMLHLMEDLAKDPKFNGGDRAWLKSEIDDSYGTHVLIGSIFAPFAILAAVVMGIVEGCGFGRKSTDVEPNDIKDLHERIDQIGITIVEGRYGIDPTTGAFWDDPRREEISKLANTIENLSHPIAVIWLLVWIVISAPILAVFFLLAGTLTPIITNLWEPLRTPIVRLLDAVTSPARS